jgi:hypothetical protein
MNINLTPEWVTAVATIILVLTTIIYVYFAGKLTQETVKLREVETTPFISISFDISYQMVSHSKLIIKNIGKAPAYSISFQVDDKYISLEMNTEVKKSIRYE